MWVLMTALSGALAYLAMQAYVNSQSRHEYLFLAMILQVLVVYGYSKILSKDQSGVLYATAKIMAIILVIVASVYLFDKEISTKQIIGLILGVIAIILLKVGN